MKFNKWLEIKENVKSNEIWYHGSPDVRSIESGFDQRFITLNYIDDIEEYDKLQKELTSARDEKGQPTDEYFKILNKVKLLKKTKQIKRPVFLTNVYSVANSYADDKRAFDYQGAEPAVVQVKVKDGKSLTIHAPGKLFRYIDINSVKRGFESAGVSAEQIDSMINKVQYYDKSQKGIQTDDIAAIAHELGFDYVDVVGVLDSYNDNERSGAPRSTVRMVFDVNNISRVHSEHNIWSEQYQYLGQCDKVRCQSGQNEINWHRMMSKKEKVSIDEFKEKVDLTPLLDEDETFDDFIQGHASDPDLGFYKSIWGNKDCYFFQSHGFEFIFVE